MRCDRQWQKTDNDTGSISLLQSAFYLSHVYHSVSWCHSQSWLTAFLMDTVVDVIQLLAAGEVSSLSQLRQLIRASEEIQVYEPKTDESWEEIYQEFKEKIVK